MLRHININGVTQTHRWNNTNQCIWLEDWTVTCVHVSQMEWWTAEYVNFSVNEARLHYSCCDGDPHPAATRPGLAGVSVPMCDNTDSQSLLPHGWVKPLKHHVHFYPLYHVGSFKCIRDRTKHSDVFVLSRLSYTKSILVHRYCAETSWIKKKGKIMLIKLTGTQM